MLPLGRLAAPKALLKECKPSGSWILYLSSPGHLPAAPPGPGGAVLLLETGCNLMLYILAAPRMPPPGRFAALQSRLK